MSVTQPPVRPSAEQRPPSALLLVNVVLRGRRLTAALATALFVITVGTTLLAKRTYTATASFTPASGSGSGALLSGLAAQLGVATGAPEQSPQFYADLIGTREILADLAEHEYVVGTGGASRRATMMDLLEIRAPTEPVRLARTVERLRGLVTARTSSRTGVVIASVQSRWPELSEALATRLMELVNRFNLETRQTQAAAERRFVEERVDSVRRDLRAAEDRLLQFLQRNREFRSSPVLVFEQERLAREVGVHQQVFASLAQAYEQARIEAVRNTPVITVIERPTRPVRPDRRRLVAKAFLAVVFGGLAGIALAVGRELFAATGRDDPDALATYRALRGETIRDLRRVGLRFLRAPQG